MGRSGFEASSRAGAAGRVAARAALTAAEAGPGGDGLHAAEGAVAVDDTRIRTELDELCAQLQGAAGDIEGACSAAVRAPASCVWSRSATRLLRLDNTLSPSKPRSPLLVVYSLVNHPAVLDLEPRRSLLRALQGVGFEVYLLDWSDEGRAVPGRPLDEYVNDLLRPALHACLADCGVRALPVVGICQGGTLALALAALEPARVSALACMVTPVDFHAPGHRLGGWLRGLDVAGLRARRDAVPGALVASIFRLLNPARLGTRRYMGMLEGNPSSDTFATRVRMERWLNAPPPLGPVALADFVERFYVDNALVRGESKIGSETVGLGDVRCPVLDIHARDDAIVPRGCSQPLASLPNAERLASLEIASGHVGALVGAAALAQVPAAIARFTRAEA